ncbi:CocE/NonD family hydrolase [Streptomyces muensis]|uniref:CocE/NonD family hydrolase n=1 Tax=Streptomyces muensis TaxID=1077944 RepID=A0A9X1Q0M6_STRM4|nr:CocE/NonD family hydrolase [Streptomyces muensis]MCF1596955.1 CocE/NonD family hydrolase [Streptomyces muensis]
MPMAARPLPSGATLFSSVVSRALDLPPKRNKVVVTRGVRIPMADGTILLADHYAPVTREPRPTILVRCPYGRGIGQVQLMALPYAERGYHVLLQSCRGTFGSGGVFEPGLGEAEDGQATVVWLRTQDWFDGRLATFGGSYLSFVQWALATDPPPELKAMVAQVSFHDFAQGGYEQGPFNLLDLLMWSDSISNQESVGALTGLLRTMRGRRRLGPFMDRLPLKGMADHLSGKGAPWFDDWVTHPDVQDAFWDRRRHGEALQRLTVPVLLTGGFQDLFLQQTLEQYRTLQDRGVPVALTLGPWTHTNASQRTILHEALAWLDAHVAGDGPTPRKQPVRVQIGGTKEWRELAQWPPAGTTEQQWYLQEGTELTTTPPGELSAEPATGSTGLHYDPADPTPAVGGRFMSPGGGQRDNSALEQRHDVITFTSRPLTRAIEVMGAPTVELELSSDNPYADIFARLCDVDAKGRSRNITDQIVRLAPDGTGPKDVRTVRIVLDDTAHRFLPGHRIRLQISGGAHPRFARNPGTPEPVATATKTASVNHRIHHTASHPSRLTLPIT